MIFVASLVTPGIGLIFWSTLFFVIVLLLLGKFAFGPIAQSLDERSKSIDDALKSAEAAKLEMASLTSKNEELLREARGERDNMLKEAKDTASKIISDAQGQSKVEADKIIKSAQQAIESEKNNALATVRKQAATLSLELAEKVLRKELEDKPSKQALAEGYLKDLNLN
ncbi:MAG: F-type H+-transporting ATPase subunit b [Flammeovirgaceae bacterium]|jgi:F-type H+-transporting ATPase subunit b